MLVCRRWHTIILSTPGIHSQLTIRRATQKEAVRAFIQGRKSRLDVRVDITDEKDGSHFNADNFHACFMAAAEAASRWSSLNLISPPPHGEHRALRILQPLVHLESFKLACGFSEFLELLMTDISRGASPNLTTMHLRDYTAVLYLVRPACLHITYSLRTLNIQLSKRMENTVDILPHLHGLEVLEAHNLCLPLYPPDASLPLTNTLRVLLLKSVSVQWMVGRVFPALENCEIIFPHNADTIQALQPVSIPSCNQVLYFSNDLHPLTHFNFPSLRELRVKSGQWNAWRGNLQLIPLCPIVAARAKSLTGLRLEVECSGRLLVFMLRLVPALKWLWLGLARPNALGTTFFQAFIVREPNTDGVSDMARPPDQTSAPLCPSLKILYLQYRRWLRSPGKKALMVAFSDIAASRNLEREYPFYLNLSIDDPRDSSGFHIYGPDVPRWSIDNPVTKSQYGRTTDSMSDLSLGLSTPHDIILLSTTIPRNRLVPLPFREADYLRLCGFDLRSSFEFLLTRDHLAVMVYDNDRPPLPNLHTCALPLFNTLRILVVKSTNPSFLTSHTFHKLERCRVVDTRYSLDASPSLFTETWMPVCTRVDVDDPYLLATFKLPRIYELALDFSYPDCNTIWEKHIAVNANLSGLCLLHMKKCPLDGDLIPILRTLPSLETLIISSRLSVFSFRALLPMDTNGISGLKHASGEVHSLALLCPRLQSLQIEWKVPSIQSELVSILKDVVTLRAECGSPLKNFTFHNLCKPGGMFELIERDGSFTMENIALDEEADEELDKESDRESGEKSDEGAGGFTLDI